MALFLSLRSNKVGDTGLVLVNAATATGYEWLSPGVLEGVLGAVQQDAIMAQSIDQSPVKVSQREGARELVMRIQIVGTSWADYVTKRDALITEIRQVNDYGGRMRFRATSGTASVEFDVQHIATGPTHSHLAEVSFTHQLEVKITCAPYALGDPMDIADTFATNTLGTGGVFNNGGADWVVRSGTAPSVTGGAMVAAAAGSATVVEHTGTPYSIGDSQQTLAFQFSAQVSGNGAGVVLKRLADGSHLRVIVNDNGTNSTLRIQKVDTGGTATDLGSVANLGARVPAATTRYVRGRIEGNVVIAEAWTTEPSPMNLASAAATTYAHTLAGGDATAFGDRVEGATGVYLAPTASASISALYWRRDAFCYVGSTSSGIGADASPSTILASGRIPGTAAAEVETRLGILASGNGGDALAVSWAPRVTGSPVDRPFGVIDASVASVATGAFSSVADASAHGGTVMRCDTSGALQWTLYPQQFEREGRDDTVLVRVVARLRLASTSIGGPTIIGSLFTTAGDISYSHEYGTTPRPLALQVPSSNTLFRLVNLGTFPIQAGRVTAYTFAMTIISPVGSTIAVDYISIQPVNRTAQSLGGIAGDPTSTTSALLRAQQVRAFAAGGPARALEAGTDGAWVTRNRTRSLLGSRVAVVPGDHMEWSVVPSMLPVDATNGTSPTLSALHGAARGVQFSVQPRYWIGG